MKFRGKKRSYDDTTEKEVDMISRIPEEKLYYAVQLLESVEDYLKI